MYVIEKDSNRAILRLAWSKHVTADKVQRRRKELKSELQGLSPGFRILADLSDLDEMASDCIPEIRRIMDSLREGGVSRIVRVIPEPHKDIGLNILSYFRYGRQVDVQTYKTLPEALSALEKSQSETTRQTGRESKKYALGQRLPDGALCPRIWCFMPI